MSLHIMVQPRPFKHIQYFIFQLPVLLNLTVVLLNHTTLSYYSKFHSEKSINYSLSLPLQFIPPRIGLLYSLRNLDHILLESSTFYNNKIFYSQQIMNLCILHIAIQASKWSLIHLLAFHFFITF